MSRVVPGGRSSPDAPGATPPRVDPPGPHRSAGGDPGGPAGGPTDTGERARLEAERDELLAALDALDAAHAAGELDDDDHRRLAADLTRRAASVIRRLEGTAGDPAPGDAPAPEPAGRGRRWLAGLLVVTLLIGAGVALARSAGERTAGGLPTGSIRETRAARLAVAEEQLADGDWEQAAATAAEVLLEAPDDVGALVLRGRALVAGGLDTDDQSLVEEGLAVLADAVAADPLAARDRARVRLQLGDLTGAIADYRTALSADMSPATEAEVRLGLAEALIADGQVLEGLREIDRVLAGDPDHVRALLLRGRTLVAAGMAGDSPELIQRGLAALDRAVELQPFSLLVRADVRATLGDTDGAVADLETLLGRDDLPGPMRDAARQALESIRGS